MFISIVASMGLLAPTLSCPTRFDDLRKPAIGDYPSILARQYMSPIFLSTIICLWKHPFVDFIFSLEPV